MTESTSEIRSVLALPNAVGESVAAGETACLLCGSAMEVTLTGLTDNRLGTPGAYEIHRCFRCGLEQTFPAPSAAKLKELYEKHYNFGGETGTLYTKLREWFFSSFLYRVWIRLDGDPAFHSRRGTGRLLDIGCNEGRGLKIYARNGFEVEGLDLNERAAAVARESGLTVQTRDISEFESPSPYDVAVLSNVLEHSPDPRQMLLDVHRNLNPGGQVWISCPNSQSWLRRAFGASWINWHVPFHISHFSSRTLCQLLAETGYGPIEVRQITPALWVAQSLIASIFAKDGRRTRQLRNPFLTLLLMTFVRIVLFPVLWLGNRRGRGDCLLAVATRA